MRRAARKDANHAQIVADLRARGFNVEDLSHVGGGVPDLYVSRWDIVNGNARRTGRWVEVKNAGARPGRKRGATQAATDEREAAFRERNPELVIVATSADQVDAAWPA